MKTSSIGNEAEAKVAKYLKKSGFKIIDKNWKTPYAEIDIVALKNSRMYFVEVKYRSTESAGDGFDYITPNKLKHMNRAAESWVTENNWAGECILMAASVLGQDGTIDLREIA